MDKQMIQVLGFLGIFALVAGAFFLGRASKQCLSVECPDKVCPEANCPTCPTVACPDLTCPEVNCPVIPACPVCKSCPDCNCGSSSDTVLTGAKFLSGQQTAEQAKLIEQGKCQLVKDWFGARQTWFWVC